MPGQGKGRIRRIHQRPDHLRSRVFEVVAVERRIDVQGDGDVAHGARPAEHFGELRNGQSSDECAVGNH
jgi:hypothetical protein